MDLKEYIYPGDELDLFSSAKNWKRYFSKRLKKYVLGNVLEVGAGNGGTTKLLINDIRHNKMSKLFFFIITGNVECMISAGIESQQTFDLARGKTFCLPLFLIVRKSNQNDLTDLVKIHKIFD